MKPQKLHPNLSYIKCALNIHYWKNIEDNSIIIIYIDNIFIHACNFINIHFSSTKWNSYVAHSWPLGLLNGINVNILSILMLWWNIFSSMHLGVEMVCKKSRIGLEHIHKFDFINMWKYINPKIPKWFIVFMFLVFDYCVLWLDLNINLLLL